MKLIVGLGNPGSVYARSRHNIGFMCLRHFAKKHDIRLDKKQGNARTGSSQVAGEKVILARPQTGMNLSGKAVSRLVKNRGISLDDLIIIHDDLDLPLGKTRISCGSSSGGHKGIDSIMTYLEKRRDFIRIKVGIGRPDIGEGPTEEKESAIVNYVLSDFTPGESKIIIKTIPEVSQEILCLITDGVAAAMNRYN
ncbi:aminoacyl-tRNA hydrolase [Chloroflexota bacterium]